MLAEVMRPKLRPVRLGASCAEQVLLPGGGCILRSATPLGEYPRFLTDRLEHWAQLKPDRSFMTERGASGARQAITYAETLQAVRAIGQALLEYGLGADRPLAILSENNIDQALLTLAGQYAGVPVAPVSPAYATMSRDYARLRMVMDVLQPGAVYAAGPAFMPALAATAAPDIKIIMSDNAVLQHTATRLAVLRDCVPGRALRDAHAARQPHDTAKILFTSGTTGTPKGVINTHRMMAANQQMILQAFAFLADEPPVLVDWLPWNHTFGGNHNVGIALYNGGTLHIDEGRPTETGMAATIANLRELSPTVYFNVPRGYDALAAALDTDAALAATFFSRLKLLFYSGAGLSPATWRYLADVAEKRCGERILMLTGLGSTETGPFAVTGLADADGPGEIGVPADGVELKLVPRGGKLELRVRSPSVTPGYWRRDDLTKLVFDEDGFYCLGDAVKYIDSANPARGLRFDGRLAEDFKLATGVWVNVAAVRARAAAALAPLVQDVIVVGHDRTEVGVLLVPHLPSCLQHFGAKPSSADTPSFADWIMTRLHALGGGGSSERVTRAGVLLRPLSLDAGELTDKGSVNAGQVAARRQALVEAIYAGGPLAWEQISTNECMIDISTIRVRAR